MYVYMYILMNNTRLKEIFDAGILGFSRLPIHARLMRVGVALVHLVSKQSTRIPFLVCSADC